MDVTITEGVLVTNTPNLKFKPDSDCKFTFYNKRIYPNPISHNFFSHMTLIFFHCLDHLPFLGVTSHFMSHFIFTPYLMFYRWLIAFFSPLYINCHIMFIVLASPSLPSPSLPTKHRLLVHSLQQQADAFFLCHRPYKEPNLPPQISEVFGKRLKLTQDGA